MEGPMFVSATYCFVIFRTVSRRLENTWQKATLKSLFLQIIQSTQKVPYGLFQWFRCIVLLPTTLSYRKCLLHTYFLGHLFFTYFPNFLIYLLVYIFQNVSSLFQYPYAIITILHGQWPKYPLYEYKIYLDFTLQTQLEYICLSNKK